MWKKIWCRYLDTISGASKERLLAIEMRIFCNVKKEIEATLGPWSGTARENFMADTKIAQSISSSFKSYEKGMKRHGSFFDFKRR